MSKQYSPNVGTVALSSGSQTVVIIEENTEILVAVSGPQGPVGAKGDKGAGVIIKGHYATLEELVAAHPVGVEGDIYSVADHLYGWDSQTAAWADLGQIGQKGDKGDAGERGEQGEAGERGDQGDQGQRGEQGERGEQGIQGLVGPAGADGTDGKDGTDGRGLDILGHYDTEAELIAEHPVGKAGDCWLVGEGFLYTWNDETNGWVNVGKLQGPKGDQGDRGDVGPAGADSTVPGPQGPAGQRGEDGPVGPRGADSTVPGPAGPAGERGADSTVPGPVGPAGEAGPVGPAGARGEKGEKGDSGSGAAAQRIILHDDEGEFHEKLTTTDLGGFVSVLFYDGGSDATTVFVTLPAVVGEAAVAGELVTVMNLNSSPTQTNVVIIAEDAKDYIVPNEDYTHIGVKNGGTARLVFAGELEDEGEKFRAWSLIGDLAPSPLKPHAPILDSVNPMDAAASLAWDMPTDGMPAQGFTVSCHEDGRGTSSNWVDGGSTRSYIWDKLKNGVSYTFSLHAAYRGIPGPESNEIVCTPHPDLPNAPQLVSATGVWDGVQAMFHAPADPNHEVKSYAANIGGKSYPLESVTDNGGLLTGFVHGLAPQTSDVFLTAVTTYGDTKPSSTMKGVVIGPKAIKPAVSAAGSGGASLKPFASYAANPVGVTKVRLSVATIEKTPTVVNFETTDMKGYVGADKPMATGTDYNLTVTFIYPNGESQPSNPFKVHTNDQDLSGPTQVKVITGFESTPVAYDRGAVQIMAPDFSAERTGTVILINDVSSSDHDGSGIAWVPSVNYGQGAVNVKVAFILNAGAGEYVQSNFYDCGMVNFASQKPDLPKGVYSLPYVDGINTARFLLQVPKGDYPLSELDVECSGPKGSDFYFNKAVPLQYDSSGRAIVTFDFPVDGVYTINYYVKNFAGRSPATVAQAFTLTKTPLPFAPQSIGVKQDGDQLRPWIRIMSPGNGQVSKYRVTRAFNKTIVWTKDYDRNVDSAAFQLAVADAIPADQIGVHSFAAQTMDQWNQLSEKNASCDYTVDKPVSDAPTVVNPASPKADG